MPLNTDAAAHVEESGTEVLDSLGRMKMVSKQAVLENAVIHRCYSYTRN